MKVLVIGLGEFGRTIAEELTDLSVEVVGIDYDETVINSIKERISFAYIMDATRQDALLELPLKEMDCAIVAIGRSMESSLRIVAALKENGLEKIYARAIDSTHCSILKAMSIENILEPEKLAAKAYARDVNVIHVV
ncbi:MAG: TrkA family potassium uptake protein [Bacteroidales bacterium]|nr:TrkA family potassium uptake protein [Bacteroidales bacterium]